MRKRPTTPKLRPAVKACRGKKGCFYTSFEKMQTNVKVTY